MWLTRLSNRQKGGKGKVKRDISILGVWGHDCVIYANWEIAWKLALEEENNDLFSSLLLRTTFTISPSGISSIVSTVVGQKKKKGHGYWNEF